MKHFVVVMSAIALVAVFSDARPESDLHDHGHEQGEGHQHGRNHQHCRPPLVCVCNDTEVTTLEPTVAPSTVEPTLPDVDANVVSVSAADSSSSEESDEQGHQHGPGHGQHGNHGHGHGRGGHRHGHGGHGHGHGGHGHGHGGHGRHRHRCPLSCVCSEPPSTTTIESTSAEPISTDLPDAEQ